MRLLSALLLLFYQEGGKDNSTHRVTMENKVIEEANPVEQSQDAFWWLNSGGYLFESRGIYRTIHGDLPEGEKWRLLHERGNPRDTEGGRKPQNIFRLVTKQVHASFRQEAYFFITSYNLTDSPERGATNGILFFSNYQDGDNTYYSGVRVDGRPIMKKKIGPTKAGIYHNLAYPPQVFPGAYDRDANPTLLPIGKWFGLRNETLMTESGSVKLRLYLDPEARGEWLPIAEAEDDGSIAGLPFPEGRAGIRTDFMDIRFRGYKAVPMAALE